MMDKPKKNSRGCDVLSGIFGILALGLILAILIGIPMRGIDGWQGSPSELSALLATGIGLAYIVLAALQWIMQTRALAADLLPDNLALSERAVAAEQLANVKGNTPIHQQLRTLLGAWSTGASGPQVATMAGYQMQRMLGRVIAETAAILALLGATAGFEAPQVLLTLGTGLMVLLMIVALARVQLALRAAAYVEAKLLARIGNDTPAAAGLEFAQAVGASVTDSTAALSQAQSAFAAQLAKVQEDTSAQLVKAQQETAALLAKSQSEAAGQLAATQGQVAEQLARVTSIAASIDNVLKLQQAVDGTLKGVTATEEFKSTLIELKRHLAESDELLRKAAQPRTIRLVEQDSQ
ncbi:MAG: hypothetical protein GX803_09815 [Lentisphaerae bacterium]|jgi:hypothetical protein|nr:hypothetical protein [Lentisphaerota bacterium]